MTVCKEGAKDFGFVDIIHHIPVLWIRIRIGPDTHHFAERHPGHAHPNPTDHNRYQFQANEKVYKVDFFPENFNLLTKLQKT